MGPVFAFTAKVDGSCIDATIDGAVQIDGELINMTDYNVLREEIDKLVKSKYISRVNVTILSLTRLSK